MSVVPPTGKAAHGQRRVASEPARPHAHPALLAAYREIITRWVLARRERQVIDLERRKSERRT